MSVLVLQNARFNGGCVDVEIEDGRFRKIRAAGERVPVEGEVCLDAEGMLLVPAFYNAHTHSAMSLLRGYADDMELFTWLNEYIWPVEGRLTSEQIYQGTRLAILEMIRSGTVFFNDMYWEPEVSLKAADEMGVRAAIGRLYIEESPGKILERNLLASAALESAYRNSAAKDRILLTFAPHAIYSVSGITLRRVAEEAQAQDGFIHIHASETAHEVEMSFKEHGMSPVQWLDTCGLLGPKTILAHCVHLSDDDIGLLRDRGAVAVNCPCSNAKLCSGQFDFERVHEKGNCRIALGTDGWASNNSLSMFDEMKWASLSAKLKSGNPACAAARDVWQAATRGGAEAFGFQAGAIEEGRLADCLLLDPGALPLIPCHHLDANLVYAADPSCVDTVICDGRVLMRHRVIPGEREIVEAAREAVVKMGS